MGVNNFPGFNRLFPFRSSDVTSWFDNRFHDVGHFFGCRESGAKVRVQECFRSPGIEVGIVSVRRVGIDQLLKLVAQCGASKFRPDLLDPPFRGRWGRWRGGKRPNRRGGARGYLVVANGDPGLVGVGDDLVAFATVMKIRIGRAIVIVNEVNGGNGETRGSWGLALAGACH